MGRLGFLSGDPVAAPLRSIERGPCATATSIEETQPGDTLPVWTCLWKRGRFAWWMPAALQAECADWVAAMSQSPTAQALEVLVDLDLDALADIDPRADTDATEKGTMKHHKALASYNPNQRRTLSAR